LIRDESPFYQWPFTGWPHILCGVSCLLLSFGNSDGVGCKQGFWVYWVILLINDPTRCFLSAIFIQLADASWLGLRKWRDKDFLCHALCSFLLTTACVPILLLSLLLLFLTGSAFALRISMTSCIRSTWIHLLPIGEVVPSAHL